MRWVTLKIAFVTLILLPHAHAQQEVKFPAVPSARISDSTEVEAVLTLPALAQGKFPAVALFHTSGGYTESAYELYAAPLRAAGIATLGVILSRAPARGVPSEYLPHTFGALRYLAAHPQIDATRIGIMGMSLGAHLAIMSSSAVLTSEHVKDSSKFRAHVALYPSCYIHDGIVRGTSRNKRLVDARPYSSLTGSPVHILAGGRDHSDTCQRFLDGLTEANRKLINLTVYPDATHNWDAGRNYEFYNRAGCDGKGCQVTVEFNPVVTEKGRQFVLDFFTKHLEEVPR